MIPFSVSHFTIFSAVCKDKAGIDDFIQKCYIEHMDDFLHLKLTIRLYSGNSTRCFGPGISALLHQVAEHNSLRSAAASMGMAYSKAWRIIRTAEDVFGCKMLNSTIGGAHGGGASLTPEAEQLLEAYDAYCADITAYSQKKFEETFPPPFFRHR